MDITNKKFIIWFYQDKPNIYGLLEFLSNKELIKIWRAYDNDILYPKDKQDLLNSIS